MDYENLTTLLGALGALLALGVSAEIVLALTTVFLVACSLR
jgi:hypothetical protein